MMNIIVTFLKSYIYRYITPIVFTIALAFASVCKAQTSVVMPPLPGSSSLVKNIDRPVSAYTGAAQIDIPLWSIKLKNLEIPIALGYDATGVKVEQEASWVGLSWSLSAGGVITRAVNDIPDDYNKDETIFRVEDRPFDTSPSGEHPRLGRFWSGKYEALRDFDFSNTPVWRGCSLFFLLERKLLSLVS